MTWKLHLKQIPSWCPRAKTPFTSTSWPSCDLPLLFSGIRKEERGGCLQRHRTCLTSHELHTPTHRVSCHIQPPDSGFIFHGGKTTPNTSSCSVPRHPGARKAQSWWWFYSFQHFWWVWQWKTVSSLEGSVLKTWETPQKSRNSWQRDTESAHLVSLMKEIE